MTDSTPPDDSDVLETAREQPEPSATRHERAGIDGTRREGTGPGGTRREGEHQRVWTRTNLPPELAARYEILGQLPSGGEADVLLCQRRDDSDDTSPVVVKIYRHGLEPDRDVLERIRSLPTAHVVRILDCGTSQFGWWEEQEYLELGSLSDLLAREGPRLAPGRVYEVIDELTDALEAAHPIWHRDLKPANIFVRNSKPLDLVLGDFGLARVSEASHVVSKVSGSLAYMSPEALDGGASAARDWWAVGMILAETASGSHPFYEEAIGWPSEPEMRIALNTRPVPLDGITDARLLLLCRGLLVRDPSQRWGLAEVRAWRSGGSPALAKDAGATMVRDRSAVIPPFVFAGARCATPESLAPILADRWPDAVRMLSGAASQAPDYVRLVVWLEDHGHESARRVLEKGAQDRSIARRLFRLLRVLDGTLTPSFRGRAVDRQGLLHLARLASDGDAEAASVAYDVLQLGIVSELSREDAYADLLELDERWRSQVELLAKLRGELGPIGAPLDNEEVSRTTTARILLALLDDDALQVLRESVDAAETAPELAENERLFTLFQRVRGVAS
jgi:eukaryotic-like serine/threonine-protein kinase